MKKPKKKEKEKVKAKVKEKRAKTPIQIIKQKKSFKNNNKYRNK